MNAKTWVRYQRNRVASWVLIGLGAVFLVVGWLGVARSIYPAEQLPYLISGGLGGLCLVGVGGLLWLSADLEDEWTKLDLIEEALRDLVAQGTPLVETTSNGTAASRSTDTPGGRSAPSKANGTSRTSNPEEARR